MSQLKNRLRTLTVIAAVLTLLVCAFPVVAESPREEQLTVYDGSAPKLYESAQADALAAVSVDYEALGDYVGEQMASFPETIDISQFNVPVSSFEDLFDYLRYYVPECFSIYYLGYGTYDDNYIACLTSISHYDFADTAEEYAEAWEEIQDAAYTLTDGIRNNNSLSDVEKALILHDRLAVWNEYESGEFGWEDYTIYGSLAQRASVCQGYALAYIYLLDLVGIKADFCSSDTLMHAWNVVYIGNTPYHVDVTWDDPVTNTGDQLLIHEYFLIDKEKLFELDSIEHQFDEKIFVEAK